jgi:acetyl-CoA carboxylase carboxyl transferase subunit alpha
LKNFLDFEKDALTVAQKRIELEKLNAEGKLPKKTKIEAERLRLDVKEKRLVRHLYRALTPWQKTLVARHGHRPHAKDYIEQLIEGFQPLAGDRRFADDAAMIAGLGYFNGQAVAVLGTEKGSNTKDRVKHNFGMPKPDGYRKAERIMLLADKFGLPLITFVDTPGAFPGVEAEARGQAEAIAKCIETSLNLNVPIVSVITGEGGSGGALAIATADKVLMLEHSIYSVISPEGCAAILWKDSASAPQAAEALKLTAQHLIELKVIDGIIKEPVGGAHRDHDLTFKRTAKAMQEALQSLKRRKTPHAQARRKRFLDIK